MTQQRTGRRTTTNRLGALCYHLNQSTYHASIHLSLTTELTTELKLISWCDLVRTVSHDRGLGYSNRLCDSAEFVHVTHTMELFLRPTPRNLSLGILGTRPRRSELESPTRSSYRVSPLPHHRRLVLGSLVSP